MTDYLDALSRIVVGSDTIPWYTQLVEPAFSSSDTLYLLQPQCVPYLSQTISYNARGIPLELNIQCVEGVLLWRESTSIINDELSKGYVQSRGKTNEFIAGYLPIFVAPIFCFFAFVAGLHSIDILLPNFIMTYDKLALESCCIIDNCLGPSIQICE